jgi:hypothetical protein
MDRREREREREREEERERERGGREREREKGRKRESCLELAKCHHISCLCQDQTSHLRVDSIDLM